jgi:geranylgeranyl diphosphate synthase, type II
MEELVISQVLNVTRESILLTIDNLLQEKKKATGAYEDLYNILSDYPFRKGKSLRGAICITLTRSVGGMAQAALISSAAIEMFHNAALLHDDFQDGSDYRRGERAMHHLIGAGRAVNLGDATHVMSLSLLLKNLKILGVAKSMFVMHEIENMARQSVEGQAMELDWIANNIFELEDDDYFRMCGKKTCWYTFISPCRIGYIIGQSNISEDDMELHLSQLSEFGMSLGIAFQIQDDLLNLTGDETKYGKEISGDIYEGKRTIMLNHLLRNSKENREKIEAIIKKPRLDKTLDEVNFVLSQMHEKGSIEYGKQLAIKYSNKAQEILNEMSFLKEIKTKRVEEIWDAPLADKRLISALVSYVVQRNL